MRSLPTGPSTPPNPDSRRTVAWSGAAVGVLTGCLIWVGLLGTVLPASATTAKTPLRVSFGIAPASARGPNGRSDLSYGVTPGAQLLDHVAILNYSSVSLSLQVYVTDATETSTGTFGLLPAGQAAPGVESWMSVPKQDSTVRVPAQSSAGPGEVVVPLLLRVPGSAQPGDHVGGVVVSLRTSAKNARGENVVLLQRVGTRVFVQVAGKLAPRLVVTHLSVTYQGTLNPAGRGRVRISYVLANTGNVDLALGTEKVALSGLLGGSEQALLGKVPLVIPGASLSESVVIARVWPQFLVRTSVSVPPLALTGGIETPLTPVSASSSVWAVPWTPLAVVVLVLASFGLAFRLRARRASQPVARRTQVVSA